MWTNLRSDLKEFASSIATDGTTVLDTIDSKLKENEVLSSLANPPTDHHDAQAEDLIAAVDPELAHANPNADASAPSSSEAGSDPTAALLLQDAQDEALRRMDMEVTYLTPLLASEVNGVKNTVVEDGNDGVETGVETGIETNGNTESTDNLDTSPEQQQEQEQLLPKTDSFTEPTESQPTTDHQQEPEQEQGETTQLLPNNTVLPQTQDNNAKHNTDQHPEDNNDDDEEEEARRFLQSFDIQSKTEEIATLLSNQTSLSQHFETLVPLQVTYEQFWQRYFFRCDPQRIILEWQQEDERARLQRKELIDKGVQSVQNIFGGALKAIKGVTASSAQEDSSNLGNGSTIYEKYQAELEQKQRAMLLSNHNRDQEDDADNVNDATNKKAGKRGILGNALTMFGGNGGRPPFVLNTAQSDDDDEEYELDEDGNDDNDEEVYDEEELSWGSDDDDDDDDDEEDEELEEEEYEDEDENEILDDSNQEIIVFEEKESDADEDVLDEINILKSMLENAQISKQETELHAQKLQEELDALKEQGKLEPSEYVQQPTSTTSDDMNHLLSQLNDAQTSKREAESTVHDLRSELTSCKEEMKQQNLSFAKSMEEQMAKLKDEHKEVVATFEATIASLNAKLQESETQKEEAEAMTNKLKEDLNTCREEAKKQSMNFAKTLEDKVAIVRAEQKGAATLLSSPSAQEGSSMSSGVEIPPSHEPEMNAAKAEDDEEDGWGDSWSDEEDDN